MKAKSHGKYNIAKTIAQARSALDAKRLGKKIIPEDHWETEKIEVMRNIIRSRAQQVPKYRQQLKSAKEIIVEAVPGDNFWSCGLSKEEVGWWNPRDWPGKNVMGRLHMELRDELESAPTTQEVCVVP